MTFQPVISHLNTVRGIHEFEVANSEGVWLGTVKVTGKHAEFMPALVWLLGEQLVAIAKFMREKADAK